MAGSNIVIPIIMNILDYKARVIKVVERTKFANQLTLKKNILDYSGGSNVFTSVLKRGGGRQNSF